MNNHNDNDEDVYNSFTAGEPIFSGPAIKSHLYQSYLDCGNYITFLQDGMTCYSVNTTENRIDNNQ